MKNAPRRAIGPILIVIALTAAGCITPPEYVSADDTDASPYRAVPTPAATQPRPSPTPTDAAEGSQDRPLHVTLNATPLQGAAPLEVRFTLNANGTGTLTWTLDVDDDGTTDHEGNELPANVTHTYPQGTWTARFVVSDGVATNESAALIHAGPEPERDPPEPMTFHGNVTGVWLGNDVGYLGQSATHGFNLAYPVQNITAQVQAGTGAFDLDFELEAPDGRIVGRSATFNDPTGTIPGAATQEAPIRVSGPDAAQTGNWTVHVHPALAIDGDYRVTLHFR